jgi:hypothetical protein
MMVGRKVGLGEKWGGTSMKRARRDGLKVIFGEKRIREQGSVHDRNLWMDDRWESACKKIGTILHKWVTGHASAVMRK